MNPTEAAALRVPRPREHAAVRLACFPHAGGGAEAYTALAGALPDDIEVLALQYPGRRERRAVPGAADIAELAGEAARALEPYADRPLSLLGHSMGALVAFETARLLEQRRTLGRLFVSAARPPGEDWEERDLDTLTDERLVAELRRLGGVPEQLLREPDVVEEILRLLRADHRALRRYGWPVDAAVRAPVSALLADADPKNTAEQMRGWARHTTGAFDLQVLSGGHFALLERASGTVRLLAGTLRADAAPADVAG